MIFWPIHLITNSPHPPSIYAHSCGHQRGHLVSRTCSSISWYRQWYHEFEWQRHQDLSSLPIPGQGHYYPCVPAFSADNTFVSPLLHLAGDGMFLLRLAQRWLNPGVTHLPSSCSQTFSISIFQEPLIAAQAGTRCIYMCIVYLLLVRCCAVDVYRSAILNQMPSISSQSGPGMKAQPAEPLRRCKVSLYRFLCSVE